MKTVLTMATALLVLASPAAAQVNTVSVKVDGLVCAFCAYGLDKQLKRIEGVEDVKVYLDAGRVDLKFKQGVAVALEDIPPTIKQAGYTPREIRVEATGRLLDWNGRPALSVEPGSTRFLLAENETLQQIRTILKGQGSDRLVTTWGRIQQEGPEKHHGHPFTLYVERFEVR